MLATVRRRCASASLRVATPLARRALSNYAVPEPTDAANIRIDFDVPYTLHKLDSEPASYTYTSSRS